jgi:protein TonB
VRTLLLTLVGLVLLGADTPPAVDAAPPGRHARERLAEIQRQVQTVAAYPPVARSRHVSGEALVAFRIDRDGVPADIRTTRSSGSVLLDRAAERAVADAAPLPWVYGEVSVPVSFVLRAAP